MTKFISFSLLLAFLIPCANAQLAPASGCLDCFNFIAPSISGAENVNPAEVGLIMYDTSKHAFRGYTQPTVWSQLAKERVVQSISASSAIPLNTDIVLADSASAAITLTLSSAASLVGRTITIKKVSAERNLVTIAASGSETIDGQVSIGLIGKDGILEIISDGSTFLVKQLSDPWRVNVSLWDIGINNINLSGSDQAAYVGLDSPDLAVTNSGSEHIRALTAKIACAGTTAPTGTTCSGANESLGIAFDVPRPGNVKACVSFAHLLQTGATGLIRTTFQIVETPANAQTISQEGNSRISSELRNASINVTQPLRVCGNFIFSSAGQKVLRLMYEQDITATVTTNSIIADAPSSIGERQIQWEVYPLE